MRSNRFLLVTITLTAVLTQLAAPAAASPIKPGTLILDFTSGPLSGQQVLGSFMVDESELNGSGVEQLVPKTANLLIFGSSSKRGFLTLDVTIDGNSFGIADDIAYPELPALFYEDGVPVAFDFVTDDPSSTGASNPLLSILIDPELVTGSPAAPNDLIYRPDGSTFDNQSTGTASFTVVPEPATVSLLAAMTLTLGWRRRGRLTV